MGPALHHAVLLLAIHAIAKAAGALTAADATLRAARGLFWLFLALFVLSILFAAMRAAREEVLPSAHRSRRRVAMDWDRIAGNWTQMKGKLREQWGKLTDDDVAQMDGSREQLEGKIQERYGYGKDQVRKEIDDWSRRLS